MSTPGPPESTIRCTVHYDRGHTNAFTHSSEKEKCMRSPVTHEKSGSELGASSTIDPCFCIPISSLGQPRHRPIPAVRSQIKWLTALQTSRQQNISSTPLPTRSLSRSRRFSCRSHTCPASPPPPAPSLPRSCC